jgi:hypothetical protein
MPYIRSEDREKVDPFIDELADQIILACKDKRDVYAFAGLVNYSFTVLIRKVVRSLFEKWDYHKIALVSGIIHTMADEFYRRIAQEYEEVKRNENGDVY